MKKLCRKRKSWLDRNSRHKSPNCSGHTPKRGRSALLAAPERFCLQVNALYGSRVNRKYRNDRKSEVDSFLKFMDELRTWKRPQLVIDMRAVELMDVAATLMFKAELQYLREHTNTHIACLPPRKNRTRQVLQQTGISGLLNLPADVETSRRDVIYWRHAQGGAYQKIDTGKDIDAIFAGFTDSPVNADLAFTALVESTLNCVEHAYKDHEQRRRLNEDSTGWWSFMETNKDKGRLTFAVYDLGIGIPNALPLKFNEEHLNLDAIKAIFYGKGGHRDTRAIRAALEYGRSGTGRSYRGKGLADVHRVIDASVSGSLAIFSNRGIYIYIVNKDKHKEPSKIHGVLLRSLCGTLYLWSIDFPPPNPTTTEESRSLQ